MDLTHACQNDVKLGMRYSHYHCLRSFRIGWQQRRVQQGRHPQSTHRQQLLEAFEELLTLLRLKVSALLPKTLLLTDPIESMLSLARHSERNIKCIRGSAMLQRWLGNVLLCCEQQFKRVKSFAGIVHVFVTIEAEQMEQQPLQTKRATGDSHGSRSENFYGRIDNSL